MSTRIQSGGPSTGVVSTPTASRVTPAPARPFRQVVGAGQSAVVNGAEAAVRRLPGGPVLAAAFRSPGGATASNPGASAEGSSGTAGPAGGSTIEDALAQNADKNLYYLQLQERISAENRSFTALSNVLKARHDTVKSAINNIRS